MRRHACPPSETVVSQEILRQLHGSARALKVMTSAQMGESGPRKAALRGDRELVRAVAWQERQAEPQSCVVASANRGA
eukprot:CAMPEP_0195089768 /NCGR_PEP_ID=MMETSP0448-20130528/28967_1 /TAXON_ID=66468 /ORGANISM="Heterocapsa triquestra, Strain CCMP 448" /LENGTH=77 /DNA_ID=CAMNT_0040123529 /DNA_START=168 /DNA_END=398 /DNA_ORIENTATION=+